MTKPFSPIIRSSGGLSGKSVRKPMQLFASTLIVAMLIMLDTFLT